MAMSVRHVMEVWVMVRWQTISLVHSGHDGEDLRLKDQDFIFLSEHRYMFTVLHVSYQNRTVHSYKFLWCYKPRAVDQKHLESFEMWYSRMMKKISWTDHVRNEKVLLRVKEQRNILHEILKRKANWIGHILRRNCLLQRVNEGNIQRGIEVTGRQGRRRRKLLEELKERRGYSHLKE